MVDDYLSDREQEEALRSWWRDNWRWIIGGVVLGLALLGGWRYWQAHRDEEAAAAGKVYAEFQNALQTRDIDQASRLLADLAQDHGGSAYTQQGRLLLAKAHVEAGKVEDALPLLRLVTESAD